MKSSKILENLLANKATKYYSEIYYYLAVNGLKMYDMRKGRDGN